MSSHVGFEIRQLLRGSEADHARERLRASWGEAVARREELVDPQDGVLLSAYLGNELVGVATYAIRDDGCEVVAIESFLKRRGVGTALMNEIRARAVAASCERIWLVTTNDNIPAFAFYQVWGMDLVEMRRNATTVARHRLKPGIPTTGVRGIPIRHELELELRLTTSTSDGDE